MPNKVKYEHGIKDWDSRDTIRESVVYDFSMIDDSEILHKKVPPKPDGYDEYGEEKASWYKEKGLDVYLKVLFPEESEFWISEKPDNMVPENFMVWSTRHLHEIEYYEPRKKNNLYDKTFFRNLNIKYEWDWKESGLYGGLAGFFANDSIVLDLGSGMGNFVAEALEKYKALNIKVIGVDYRYHQERPANSNMILVGGDFKNLSFPDNAFNRLLSFNSFPYWLPSTGALMLKCFKEITRISRDSALWRGTLPFDSYTHLHNSISEQAVFDGFCANGWEVVDVMHRKFAAKLHK